MMPRKLKQLVRCALKHFVDRSAYQPAGCNNVLALLLHLCDMDEELRLWILRWIAYQLRNPGAKMTTALVINGRHFDKNTFFEDVLSTLFAGESRVITADQLHDKCAAWAVASCSLVVIHGTLTQRHAIRLRDLVTAKAVVDELRGKAPQTRPNHLNFVFLSGSPDFLPADMGNRRFAIIEVPSAWPRAFHEAVHEELKNGGVKAFLEYLMRDLDMGGFNESTQPPVPALQGRKQQEAA